MDDLIGNVTDATIDAYVSSPAAVVVFGIANCEGCAFMDSVLADLAPRLNGRVKFGKAKMHVPGACREIKKRYTFETYRPLTCTHKGSWSKSGKGRWTWLTWTVRSRACC